MQEWKLNHFRLSWIDIFTCRSIYDCCCCCCCITFKSILKKILLVFLNIMNSWVKKENQRMNLFVR